MLRGMPGRVASCQDQRTEFKTVSAMNFLDRKIICRISFTAGIDFCRSQSLFQFPSAAHEVGVNVRLEDVRNRHTMFSAQLQVDLDVWLRIDHGSSLAAVISDQIRQLGNACRLDAFKYHGHKTPLCV